ncbi:hypothetical protein QN416_25725, partial [Glaciimonas sp. Cout2]|uniref:hypothetical protein n=1 Tax=Glaciimonas sp. Cout2 TaxID=3048621 RepID=UPI002B23B7F9
ELYPIGGFDAVNFVNICLVVVVGFVRCFVYFDLFKLFFFCIFCFWGMFIFILRLRVLIV